MPYKLARRGRARQRISNVRIVAAVLIATLIGSGSMLLNAWVAPRPAQSKSSGSATLSVRLNGPLDARFAGPILAQQLGLFAEEGLDVDLKPDSNERDSIESVAAGRDTIGLVRADTFMLARAQGAPIVAFAAGYLETPVVFFSVRQSEAQEHNAFIGRRVAYHAGEETAFIYESLMDRLRIPRNRIHEVASANDPAAFIDGDIDIWPGYISDDLAISCSSSPSCKIIRPSDYGLHVPGSVYFVTEKTLHENPAALRGFLKAVIAGWTAAYGPDVQALPVLAATSPLRSGERLSLDLAQQRWIVRPPGHRFAEFDEPAWRMLCDILLTTKLLREEIDISQAVTFDILREVYRKPVPSHP